VHILFGGILSTGILHRACAAVRRGKKATQCSKKTAYRPEASSRLGASWASADESTLRKCKKDRGMALSNRVQLAESLHIHKLLEEFSEPEGACGSLH
jgi:hypothetical protein